jgi:UDP-N-acetylglucosamine acyltransferase
VSARVHPTALVDPKAQLGVDVEVGPFCILGPDVIVGDRTVLGPRVSLHQYTRLGSDVRIGEGSVMAGLPQDLKFKGEETWVEIGNGTTVREFCTFNRGTSQSFKTSVGEKCFIMSYVHLAHDCHVGNGVTIANGSNLAGHVTVHDRAGLSGLVAVHQFVKIGAFAFVGGCTRVNQDVPPFVKAVGNPMELFGLNSVGLQRAGFAPETIQALKKVYRLYFNSDLNLSQATERARADLPPSPEVEQFISFIESSDRGVPS